MIAVVCPAGHASDEDDFCSTCGAALVAARGVGGCPDCGFPRPRDAGEARYCEVCRYDFLARRPGPPPAAEPPCAWEVVIAVDPGLDVDPDPAVPAPSEPPLVVPLAGATTLVGRRDPRARPEPDVALTDPGVSRRHLCLERTTAGGLVVRDLGSANGTRLNGADVPVGEPRAVADGDALELGRWTRMVLRVRARP